MDILFFISSASTYILFYLLISFSCILFSSKEGLLTHVKLVSFWFYLLLFFSIILFSGLRWRTGTDWKPYYNLFINLKLDWNYLKKIPHFDFGYIIFNAIIKFFTDSYTIFLIVDTLFACVLIEYVIYKTVKYKFLSLLIFFSYYFLAHFLGSNRRIIALGIAFLAYYLLYREKKIAFFLCIFLAFLFHRSSIIIICAYFIPMCRIKKFSFYFLLGLALVCGYFQFFFNFLGFLADLFDKFTGIPLITSLYFYAKHQSEEQLGSPLFFIFASCKRLFFISLYWYYIIKHRIKDKKVLFFFNIYFFSVVTYLSLNGAGVFQILTTYFTMIDILLIPVLYSFLKQKEKYFFLSLILINSFLQVFSAFNVYPELYLPYLSVFSDIYREVY